MSSARRRIFVVEDQRLIAADLENTLRKLGYDVVGSAASGEEAIARAPEAAPDLVLMDIRLRGKMDGIQAAALIRRRIDIPIVYLTAYADEETIRSAKLTGPFGYVVKPFNERELRAAIEIALYKHETDRLLAAERSRRQAAEELSLVVESVKDYAIFRLDVDGHVTTWNAGAARILGYRPDEILGQHFSVFRMAEDIQADKPGAALRAAIASGRCEDETWRVRKDGSRFWANVVITALRDHAGRLVGFGLVIRDLTERRRQEEALRASLRQLAESEEVFRSFFNLAVAGMAQNDPVTGKFIRVNAKMEEMTGYSEAELRAMTLSDLTHPEDRQRNGESFRAMGEGRIPHYTTEKRYVRKDGTAIWVLLNATVVHDEAGKPIRIVGVIQDITALKETEQKLREAVRARDEFLQIASHELKTPLTLLQLQLDLMARALEKSGDQSERLAERLEKASRQTARLTHLIESLLDVSRISAGKVPLQLEEFDFAEMVRDVAERFRPEADRAGCALTVRADAVLLGCWDRLRAEQVVSNLLSNAIKYGAGKPVDVAVGARDGVVWLTVADQGIGIAEEALGRIFERFERAVSMRHFGGLGLGLFIARQVIDAHGGTIAVRSQPGAGAIFTVRLPCQPGAGPGVDATRVDAMRDDATQIDATGEVR
jgi:PAS domain S-box-containing protein